MAAIHLGWVLKDFIDASLFFMCIKKHNTI
jgi:hypothetical protein